MLHDLIRAGAFRVGMRDHIIWEQIIFQIGIGQRLGVQRLPLARLQEGLLSPLDSTDEDPEGGT
jgi:hypothetical protein